MVLRFTWEAPQNADTQALDMNQTESEFLGLEPSPRLCIVGKHPGDADYQSGL